MLLFVIILSGVGYDSQKKKSNKLFLGVNKKIIKNKNINILNR